MKDKKKNIVMVASIILAFTISIAGTVAWMLTNSAAVTNTFEPACVPNEIVETINGNVKQNVTVRNTGNINAYIRAKIIVSWAEVNNNGTPTGKVYSAKPAEGTDYSFTRLAGTNWAKHGDYYYFKTPVAAGDVPKVNNDISYLFTECWQLPTAAIPVSDTAGCTYVLSVEIMGQSIQADGTDENGVKAVVLAWGVDPETLP